MNWDKIDFIMILRIILLVVSFIFMAGVIHHGDIVIADGFVSLYILIGVMTSLIIEKL